MSEIYKQTSPDSGQMEREGMIKVWMIDDDTNLFGSVSRNLRGGDVNIDLVNFTDGESALSAVVAERPDIILVDGDLGGGHKTGDQIVEGLRSLGVAGKIVAFSTSKDSNQKMLAAGADLAFSKDYTGIKEVRKLAKEIKDSSRTPGLATEAATTAEAEKEEAIER